MAFTDPILAAPGVSDISTTRSFLVARLWKRKGVVNIG